ncbi:MAG: helix-turn-helix domain-containing protein [Candidatus Moraniibacteriota bacterium]|jgi:cytoskeletal protein RodZ
MEKKNFTRKKVQSFTLGETLMQMREGRRMRSNDLAHEINVKASYIDALEIGDYDNLPMKVYVKGYVRSYARFFGVSDKNLLDMFEREYSIYQNINKKDEEEEVQRLPKVPKIVFTPKIIVVIISLVALSGIGLYLYFSVDNFISSPWLIVENPVSGSVINNNKVEVKGKTRSNSQVFINDQQIFVDMDGKFSDIVSLNNGLNAINIKSVNKFEKESVEKIVIEANYEIEKTEEIIDKKVHLIIKSMKGPVWIQVVSDGVQIYNDTLELDEEKTFDAIDNINITTSKGDDTFIKFGDTEDFETINDNPGIVRDINYDINGLVNEDIEEKEKKDDNK